MVIAAMVIAAMVIAAMVIAGTGQGGAPRHNTKEARE